MLSYSKFFESEDLNFKINPLYINIFSHFTTGMVQFKSKPTCADTTCPLNSQCHELRPAVCRCNDGYVFDVTTKTCKSTDKQVFKTTNLHLNKQFLPSYAVSTSDEFIRLAMHVEKVTYIAIHCLFWFFCHK